MLGVALHGPGEVALDAGREFVPLGQHLVGDQDAAQVGGTAPCPQVGVLVHERLVPNGLCLLMAAMGLEISRGGEV
ncbi:hypothetical protein ACFXPY_17295 [Streptomyces sp. NPDC059153]|uniref:hypothetical protein n=1 Tax=unclassified Streptomyces TaxID=2593676 RepID=UPI003696894F